MSLVAVRHSASLRLFPAAVAAARVLRRHLSSPPPPSVAGVQALLGHALGLPPVWAHSLHLCAATGSVLHLEEEVALTPARSADGSLAAVPFRLTRNMQVALGPFALEGPYVAAIASTAEAMHHRKYAAACPLEAWLSCLERDRPVRWTCEPLATEGDEAVRRPNPVLGRIAALAPSHALDLAQAQPVGQHPSVVSMNLKVAELIEAATSATNLGRMPPGWQAWL
ncbi:hypothetical protein T492DRAFT_848510 [Pavlovales sp. CCMP2436]|nr:hypothetical protein T492DRAFT_848510 [Pavlovales sp. CCMP2436]